MLAGGGMFVPAPERRYRDRAVGGDG